MTNKVKTEQVHPWAALWSLVLGFFMILMDTTIVSVANPAIMTGLHTTMVTTLWATSSYLLAYAVPLLITGRLGDRFGQRRIYLTGLAVFTFSSLACGFSHTIEVLIVARVVQGLGASLMTPQTMAVITRIFPPNQRGQAMAIWGVTAGVATLVGPVLGGFIVSVIGWEWIFFINVPVGVIGFVLALRFVPRLAGGMHSFDWLGVALSALGMFLLVFGVQEGENFAWGTIWGPFTVWGVIGAGIVILAVFVAWQWLQERRGSGQPLIPLSLFRDRNFSIGSAVIVTCGFTAVSTSVPLMFYLQLVLHLSPLMAALVMSPMAIMSIALARPVGLLIDSRDPRRVTIIGLLLVACGTGGYGLSAATAAPLWMFLLASLVLGIGNACMWGPLASISTYGLKPAQAGAGSGVYNTTRQIGSVLGSAGMAAVIAAQLQVHLSPAAAARAENGEVPSHLAAAYGQAMAGSFVLPAAVILLGAVLTLFFAPRRTATANAAKK